MATNRPSEIPQQVAEITRLHPNTQKASHSRNTGRASRVTDIARQRNEARRVEAMNLRLAGFSYESIAERMGVSESAVHALIGRTLEKAVNYSVDQLREVENARLDRAQAAIWTRVLSGDEKAIDSFLRISQRRARLNGLDAPQQVNLRVSVRNEMEHALGELRQVMMQEVVDAEVLGDGDDDNEDDPS